MDVRGLAPRLALMACALCVAAALAGCTGTPATSSVSVSGKTLTIYASSPAGLQGDVRAQDVLAAEQLAFDQAGGHVGGYTLKLTILHGAKVSDDARTAIEDGTAIAYLGEILPGQSAGSLGITNDQDVLQVSPTDNAVELTRNSSAVPGSPDLYYQALTTYGRTFARVVPSSALEAKALLAAAAARHVTKLYVTDDGQHYGAALAAAVRQAAGGAVTVASGPPTSAAVSASGAGGVLFATADEAAATRLFDAVAGAQPGTTLLAPSALADPHFAGSLSAAAQKALQVTSPGFTTAQLNTAGRQFVAAFRAAHGRDPVPQAIFGYEAMSAVISVLREAGTGASNRTTVVHDFFAIHNRASVLGTYSIDSDGDVNVAPFVVNRIRSGALDPYRFISEPG